MNRVRRVDHPRVQRRKTVDRCPVRGVAQAYWDVLCSTFALLGERDRILERFEATTDLAARAELAQELAAVWLALAESYAYLARRSRPRA